MLERSNEEKKAIREISNKGIFLGVYSFYLLLNNIVL